MTNEIQPLVLGPMGLTLLIIILLVVLIVATLALLSRHKKAGEGLLHLTGSTAVVDTKLDPQGTVLVRGELWRARSNDGETIPAHATVRIMGADGHLLLVQYNPTNLL